MTPPDDTRAFCDEVVVRDVLKKLRVRAGFRSQGPRPIDKTWWTVELFCVRTCMPPSFQCRLTYKRRQSTMGLRDTDITSRTQAIWITAKTWRLSTTGIDRIIAAMRAARVVIKSDHLEAASEHHQKGQDTMIHCYDRAEDRPEGTALIMVCGATSAMPETSAPYVDTKAAFRGLPAADKCAACAERLAQTADGPDILQQHALALPTEDHAAFWRAVDDVAGLGWPKERVLAKAIEVVERARKLRRPPRENYRHEGRRQIQLTGDPALRKLLNDTPKSVLADVVLLLLQGARPTDPATPFQQQVRELIKQLKTRET